MKATKSDGFTIKRVTLTEKGVTYETYWLRGQIAGERIRRQFKTKSAALTEKNRLEVEAADLDGSIRAVPTRLSPVQVKTAEMLFSLVPDPLAAIQWYLTNYRPPLVSAPIETAAAEFMRDREPQVSIGAVIDYRKVTGLLLKAFAGRMVDTITTPELETIMSTWGQSKKSWNNIRCYLHAFFAFCAHTSRRWITTNPVKEITVYEIARGIPDIVTAETVARLFAFLETYAGPPKAANKPGYLVPYFALATFAGIRPAVDDGEIRKIHELADKSAIIDLDVGVIRMIPEITKTNDLRQVTIQPNLAAWLKRYPIAKFPLIVRNPMDHVGLVRKQFGLTADVLRHTFISMHVAKFKSLGATALEAGNSESIIKKHYLNRVTDAVAAAFWAVEPAAQPAA